jgi:hypothetical protein
MRFAEFILSGLGYARAIRDREPRVSAVGNGLGKDAVHISDIDEGSRRFVMNRPVVLILISIAISVR